MSVFRKQTSRKGTVIYEQVLQKNFEIIETFLKKFHQIFTKQDQLEQHLNKFTERFTQYDQVLDQFRQQQRLNIVMLQKKLNNMKNTVRQNHRGSHHFSKINLPSVQASDGKKNFTLLKFDSQDHSSPLNQQVQFQRKQTNQTDFKNKQLDQIQDSITSFKDQIAEMKDKISFLSAYTSSMSNQEGNKAKSQTLKRQILQSLQNQAKDKVQTQIQRQIIQTEKVFLQQINNLAVKFSDQLNQNIDKRYQNIQNQISQFDKCIFKAEQAKNLEIQMKINLKNLADECTNIFSNKEQTKRSISLLQMKVKNLKIFLKDQFNKSQTEKQQLQYLQSLLLVNSNVYVGKQNSSLQKTYKSKSQIIKHKNHSSSLTFYDQPKCSKQNTLRKSSLANQQISKGSLFTSQVSKQFMKNFGLNQKKLVKGNFQNNKKCNKKDDNFISKRQIGVQLQPQIKGSITFE